MHDAAHLPVHAEKPKTMAEAKQVGDQVAMQGFGGGFMPAPSTMSEVLDFARLMAGSGPLVGKSVRDNPGACLGIIMQAGRLGMDPFALSQKAYVAGSGGTVAYEAQAIVAMIYASPIIEGRLRYEFEGEGPSRRVTVYGKLKGETQERPYESPPIASIKVKNSPLWHADPDQQLSYYSARAWARRHCPDVILGLYTPDEMDGYEPRNITPKSEISDPAQRLTARLENAAQDQAASGLETAPAKQPETPQPEPQTAATEEPEATAQQELLIDETPADEPAMESIVEKTTDTEAPSEPEALPSLPEIREPVMANDKQLRLWGGAALTRIERGSPVEAGKLWADSLAIIEQIAERLPSLHDELTSAIDAVKP